MHAIDEVPYSSAAEFLNALDPVHWCTASMWELEWVFRGQRCSTWNLTPSAWRDTESPGIHRLKKLRLGFANAFGDEVKKLVADSIDTGKFKRYDADSVLFAFAQTRAELTLIQEFAELADSFGFRMPNLGELLSESHVMDAVMSCGTCVGFTGQLGLPSLTVIAALAQHHGIPTRALDWSRSPYAAAYFAASEVERNKPSAKKLAVWALRLQPLMEPRDYAVDPSHGREASIAVTLPNSENTYLRMQQGLFTYPVLADDYLARNGTFPSLERYVAETVEPTFGSTLQQLTLPVEHAGELLRLLALRGVSRGHLMPSLDTVAQTLAKKWEWMN